jgi:molybdenum cofactor guanylyltransferase
MIRKTLAIIAGGKSSRIGKNKALLKYRNKTFIENIIEAGDSYDEILIVSNTDVKVENLNIRIVKDIFKEYGPMGGIHSALVNAKYEKVLCIACDMPLISKETLNRLGSEKEDYEVLVPVVDRYFEPLCAIYSKRIIDKLELSIKNNQTKLQDFIKTLDYKVANEKYRIFKQDDFYNINTLSEYEKLV